MDTHGKGACNGDIAHLVAVGRNLWPPFGPQVLLTLVTGVSPCVSSQVRELAESVLRDPVFLTVGSDNAGAASIDQRLMYVGMEDGKLLAIRQLVQDGLRPPVLVFLQSKDRAQV